MASILNPLTTWNGITVALSDGHGMETAGKRTPYINALKRSIRENEFNAPVVDFLTELLRKNGFKVLHVSDGNTDVPLKTRTDAANKQKADIYVSIHYNASDSKFDGDAKDPSGLEIFVYNGNLNYNSGKLANCVAKYLKQGTVQKWRGIKEGNLHEVRETKMPAILTECGFMDNEREAMLMLDVNFQKECAEEHARGICDYFGKPFKVGFDKPVTVTKPVTTAPTKTDELKGTEPMIKFIEQHQLNRLAGIYKDARTAGVISSDQWEKKAANGTITVGEVAFLATVIEHERTAKAKK